MLIADRVLFFLLAGIAGLVGNLLIGPTPLWKSVLVFLAFGTSWHFFNRAYWGKKCANDRL